MQLRGKTMTINKLNRVHEKVGGREAGNDIIIISKPTTHSKAHRFQRWPLEPSLSIQWHKDICTVVKLSALSISMSLPQIGTPFPLPRHLSNFPMGTVQAI